MQVFAKRKKFQTAQPSGGILLNVISKMEFVERFLGTKRRKQEKLLTVMGISGELGKELVGPKFEDTPVVTVDNDQFLKILESGKHEKVLSHLVHQSDTHQYHELYIDVGEGVKVKTGVASIDYNGQRTLFSDLNEMSFKYNPKESKDQWGVYEVERS